MNTGFLDTNLTRTSSQWLLGIVQKPACLHQHSHYRWNFSFFALTFQHILHRSIIFKLVSDSCYCYPWWWCTKFYPPTSLNFNIFHFPITLQWPRSSNDNFTVTLVSSHKVRCYAFPVPSESTPLVIILASGFEVRGFDPGRGRWIFSERKNPDYDFLRKGSKAVRPVP